MNAELEYNPPTFLKLNGVFTKAISLVGTIVLYYLAIKTGVKPHEYYGFSAAYGELMGAFTALAGIAVSVAAIRPVLEMLLHKASKLLCLPGNNLLAISKDQCHRERPYTHLHRQRTRFPPRDNLLGHGSFEHIVAHRLARRRAGDGELTRQRNESNN